VSKMPFLQVQWEIAADKEPPLQCFSKMAFFICDRRGLLPWEG